jgi:hypothetical protein
MGRISLLWSQKIGSFSFFKLQLSNLIYIFNFSGSSYLDLAYHPRAYEILKSVDSVTTLINTLLGRNQGTWVAQ